MAKKKPKRKVTVERRMVKLSDVQPGPIFHKSLSEEQQRRIKQIWKVVGPDYSNEKMTLEQFEVGFMRDVLADREIYVWEVIAKAWLEFQKTQPRPTKDIRRLFSTLVMISAGAKAEQTKVTKAQYNRLLAAWKAAWEAAENG